MEMLKNSDGRLRARNAFLIGTLLLAVLFLLGPAGSAQVVPGPQAAKSAGAADHGNKYILSFRPGTTKATRALTVRRAGGRLRFNYTIVNAAAVTVPNENALAALRLDPSVLQVIPDRPVYAIQSASKKPSEPGGGGNGKKDNGGGDQAVPSGVARVGAAPGASQFTGDGVGVAVLDTGIDLDHPDLGNPVDLFSAFGGSAQDDEGHGTHVGGIIAALNNTIDVVGVAPGATLYAVKVLNYQGLGSDSDVIMGLEAVANSTMTPAIRVVNMSLSRPGTLNDNSALRAAVQAVTNAGITVVVAAGNESNKEVSEKVPATYPEVMAVASTTADDGSNRCRFFSGFIAADTASLFTTDGAFNTTTGIGVTISAPGAKQENINRGCFAKSEGILSLKLGGGTTRGSGTSMAAPHVAGVVALMFQQDGNTTPEEARTAIRGGADRIVVAPLDSPTVGYDFDGEREGILNAPGALGALGP